MATAGAFQTINNQAIRWQDKQGFVHACEFGDPHPGVRLIWTLCQRDVPAGSAFLSQEDVTCATCKARAVITSQEA